MQSGSPQRDRLVEVAAELFYRDGVTNVGINKITNEADVARMTLYNNFSNKEDLILTCLELHSQRRQDMITAALSRCKVAEEKIKAFFQVAERLAKKPDFRGCAFVNAALQISDPDSPVHRVVRSHKEWIRSKISTDILADLTAPNAPRLAEQMLALWDGAIVETYIQQSREPVQASCSAAVTLWHAETARVA